VFVSLPDYGRLAVWYRSVYQLIIAADHFMLSQPATVAHSSPQNQL